MKKPAEHQDILETIDVLGRCLHDGMLSTDGGTMLTYVRLIQISALVRSRMTEEERCMANAMLLATPKDAPAPRPAEKTDEDEPKMPVLKAVLELQSTWVEHWKKLCRSRS